MITEERLTEKLTAVTIRPAQVEDAEQFNAIVNDAIEVLNSKDYTPEQIQALTSGRPSDTAEFFRRTISEQRSKVFVAEVGAEIIGFTALRAQSIDSLFVHSLFARQKIGTRLLNQAEREAASTNIKKLEVNSSVTAVPFYLSRGFKIVEEVSYKISCGEENENFLRESNVGELATSYLAYPTVEIQTVLMEKEF